MSVETWLKLDEAVDPDLPKGLPPSFYQQHFRGDIPMELTKEQEQNKRPASMLAIPIPKPKLPRHLVDEPTVTMLFPIKLSLNLDEYMGLVHFEKGLQEVPVSLAINYPKSKENQTGMHWYLVQQGVTRYVAPEEPKPDPAEMAKQLEAAGYKVEPPAVADDVDDIEDEEVVAPVRMEPTEPVKPARAARRRS